MQVSIGVKNPPCVVVETEDTGPRADPIQTPQASVPGTEQEQQETQGHGRPGGAASTPTTDVLTRRMFI